MSMPIYPCPACGSLVFDEPPGSYEICQACGWEDDAVQLANPTTGGGANGESLVEAQARCHGLDRLPNVLCDAAWREVNEREAGWHQSERKVSGTPWPNRATDLYYWTHPFEPVHAVPDWYDGPVSGLADYRGRPHRFRCLFDDVQDEYSQTYELEPVSDRVAALERELWRLWTRWLDAFEAGSAELGSHPCLPADRAAHDAAVVELAACEPLDAKRIVAAATFRGDLRRCTDGRVQWRVLDGGHGRRREPE